MVEYQVAGVPDVQVNYDGMAVIAIPVRPPMDDAMTTVVNQWRWGPGDDDFEMGAVGRGTIEIVCKATNVERTLEWIAKADGTGALASMTKKSHELLAERDRSLRDGTTAASEWFRKLGEN